jgi:hypothetical protein
VRVEKSEVKYPCGVCGKGVGSTSIKSIGCVKFIHGNKCSGLAGKLPKVDHSVYFCPMCVRGKSVTGKEDGEYILSETD